MLGTKLDIELREPPGSRLGTEVGMLGEWLGSRLEMELETALGCKLGSNLEKELGTPLSSSLRA